MGYGSEIFGLLKQLSIDNELNDLESVCDFGSQELHFAEKDFYSNSSAEIIRQTIFAMGGPKISDDELSKLAARSSTEKFYKYLGIHYTCLDSDGKYGRPFDFNFDQPDGSDLLRYSLVVNAGTTEHLLNQSNSFKIAHDITQNNGVMIHALPFIGFVDHGFLNYHPNLFTALAHHNNYKLIGLWVSVAGMNSLLPWRPNILSYLTSPNGRIPDTSILCALRKSKSGDFQIPFQGRYESILDKSIQTNYLDTGINTETNTAIVSSPIDQYSGRQLLAAIGDRILKRFRSN